jgi:hypothetical protein
MRNALMIHCFAVEKRDGKQELLLMVEVNNGT